MSGTPYEVTVDPRYSYPGADPEDWTATLDLLAGAQLYWLSTVRPCGTPHVTPVAGAWHDGALWFCALPTEQKMRNLRANPRCTMLTGMNVLGEGVDVTVTGEAARVTDSAVLEAAAETFRAKYGPAWDYKVDGDLYEGAVGRAWGMRIAPHTVFAFRKDKVKQTRWRLAA
ncbi:pyridoxamine 5'-phosphate oxidase family protein [Micromonospora echinospora]